MSVDIPVTEKLRVVLSYFRFKATQNNLRTNENIIADTTYGKIKGVKWRTIYGHHVYYSFEGIPFAQPPLGELRFKAPIEPKPWSGCKQCTRTRAKPFQYNVLLCRTEGSEDCLYLNVYTKELKPAKPMPVLVWIYGGGFQMGEASREVCSPDYIMMENVVLVMAAYRLGPLGFLSLNDEDCGTPGNAGLKDQILSLKWVKNNCHFFGGDSANITVFGESAGAASLHYLMMIEQAKNLFHKAVAMSGCIMVPWALTPNLDWAYRLAIGTGYKGENKDKNVLHHLMKLKPSIMFKVCDTLLTKDEVQNKELLFCFGPCVEPYKTDDCVIDRKPLEMLRNNWGNSIPLLIGGNSFEGLMGFPKVKMYPYLLTDFDEVSMPPLDANLTPDKRLQYGRMIKQAYFGDKPISRETILEYCDFISYGSCWHGIHRTLLARREYATAPTFLYRFDFDSKDFNIARILMCGRKIRGTCHADDLGYIFYNVCAKKLKSRSAEYKTIRRMITMLVKFAEYGDPSLMLKDSISCRPPSLNSCSNKQHKHQVQHTAKDNGHYGDNNENVLPKNNGNVADMDESNVCCDCTNNVDNMNLLLAHQVQNQCWPQITCCDGTTPFKCLNISDELQVIDLPEDEKLKLWDSMYEDKSLLY